MAYLILVVDDEPDWEIIILQKFHKQIQRKEWEFIFALNGLQALERLDNNPGIDIVILDYKMPEMDGLTFLNKLNETTNPTIKTIIVTAFDGIGNIRKAMNGGAFDFLTKPVSFEDLEITIGKALKQVDIIKEALKSRGMLAALNRDLEIAANIQKSMLPRTFPPFPQRKEFDIFSQMIPAKIIGGDFYDFFFVDENRIAIAIGDTSGKGISAALYMAKICNLLKATALYLINPGECLHKLNKLLIAEKHENDNFSVTLFYGVLNIATGVMQYAYAGHPAPFFVRADGEIEQIRQECPMAFPLAFLESSEYEVEKIQFQKGDTLIGYTDGVTDAENPEGIQFDHDKKRLKESLKNTNTMPPQDIIKQIMTNIETFVTGAEQTDDITALALRYYGGSSRP